MNKLRWFGEIFILEILKSWRQQKTEELLLRWTSSFSNHQKLKKINNNMNSSSFTSLTFIERLEILSKKIAATLAPGQQLINLTFNLVIKTPAAIISPAAFFILQNTSRLVCFRSPNQQAKNVRGKIQLIPPKTSQRKKTRQEIKVIKFSLITPATTSPAISVFLLLASLFHQWNKKKIWRDVWETFLLFLLLLFFN